MAYEGTQIGEDGKRRKVDGDSSEPQYVIDDRDPAQELVDRDEDRKAAAEAEAQEAQAVAAKAAEEKARVDDEIAAELAEIRAQQQSQESGDKAGEADDDDSDEGDEFPKHVGGGTYELRSGERVKGKAEAEKAQEAEDA